MEFYGADHYYFWQGIEKAQKAPETDLGEVLDNLIAIDGAMAVKCREAYMWGFIWGLRLTSTEYYSMLDQYKPSKVMQVQTVRGKKTPIPGTFPKTGDENMDKIIDDLNKEFPIKGNC